MFLAGKVLAEHFQTIRRQKSFLRGTVENNRVSSGESLCFNSRLEKVTCSAEFELFKVYCLNNPNFPPREDVMSNCSYNLARNANLNLWRGIPKCEDSCEKFKDFRISR